MEKLIDKLGLYDIWTILFPGSFFLMVSKTIYDFMVMLPEMIQHTTSVMERLFLIFKTDVYVPSTVYELLFFLLLSYIFGSILHEISSVFKHKILYKHGSPIDFLWDSHKGVFNEEQINMLMPIYQQVYGTSDAVKEKTHGKQESRKFFHEINLSLQRTQIANQYVKLNIIHNTCITLSVALFFELSLVVLFVIDFWFRGRLELIFPTVNLIPVLIAGQYVFIYRSKKYYKYWVRNIVLAYYEWYKNVFTKA